MGLGALGQNQMWCNSVGFVRLACTSFDFVKRGFVLSFICSFVYFLHFRCFRVADNGKSICEGRAKLDEKFNIDQQKRMLFSWN